MAKQTLLLIIGLTFITIALVVIAILPKTPQQPTNQTAAPAPAKKIPVAQTTMALISETASTSSTRTIDITVNAGQTNKISAVQLALSFDPKVLTNVTIQPGDFLPSPFVLINKIDPVKGTISYVLGVNPQATAKSGEGVVAKISFQSLLKPGETTQINVLPDTLITAEGVSQSVLIKIPDTFVVTNEANTQTMQNTQPVTNSQVKPY